MENLDFLVEVYNNIAIWVENEFLVIGNLIELVIIILFYIFSYFLTGKLTGAVKKGLTWIKILTDEQRKKIINEILKSMVFVLLVSIYLLFGELFPLPIFLSDIIANITFALVIIRLTVILLPRGTAMVKIIFFLIWSVAVLNILGIYGQTVEILEEIRFASGNLNISLMAIIRGILLFSILFWLEEKVSRIIINRIRESDSFTPSVKVLLNKLSKTLLYILVIFVTLSSLGVDLSSFAFLGGAIGVGLGFGLQKIVSNYISGIIILLDKSVKPGDVIEINDVYGRIKSQETRFVSLVTRAGKEYLIPNESFITNQVINWSYSDDLVRLEAKVGVSYKSDIHQVRDLLLQAVNEKDRVVEYPPPVCLLTEFGSSSVNFEIRFWIKDPSEGVANIRSDVLFSIWDLLKENDIQIPFPQQDVHFKSMSPEVKEVAEKFSQESGFQEAAVTQQED